MRVFITGIDGYLGWPLQQSLRDRGWQVTGCDNFRRRYLAHSLTDLDRDKSYPNYDVRDLDHFYDHLNEFSPDAIVHLAEEPSAAYSMSTAFAGVDTVNNNLAGTMAVLGWLRDNPRTHLIKLGTMGEYCPSSYYHMSKVCDTSILGWATKVYGLRVTDVMQGPVYGVGGRFDYDECWGTVINRFVVQGIVGGPITVYGSGDQVRSFLPVTDSIKCLRIIASNPPRPGEHRIINQYATSHTIKSLAYKISALTGAPVDFLSNPREELDSYEGDPQNDWLIKHGYRPAGSIDGHLEDLVASVKPLANRVDCDKFMPTIVWSRQQFQSENRMESEMIAHG